MWPDVSPDEPLPFDPFDIVVSRAPDAPDPYDDPANIPDGPREHRREPVEVLADAVLGARLSRHHESELMAAAEHVAGLRGHHEVMLVNVLAELEARGEEPPGGLSRVDWLRSIEPGLNAGQAKAFVTVAKAMTEPRWSELRGRVAMQHLTVAKAALVVDFHERLSPVADPADLATAVSDLIHQAPGLRSEELARLVRHHADQVTPPPDLDHVDEGRRRARALWFAPPNATGMVRMTATLDPEAAAVIRSAVDPLSAPCPATDDQGRTTQPDERTPAKRRADALVEVVARGVSAPDGVPTTDKAKVVVTVGLDVLTGRLRGTGLTASGEVLSAGTVRRLACDAGIVPMVLGTRSEPLDVGRERRLVTRGLRVALVARDRGCSFPGCSMPAAWTDAHHDLPWWSGGATSLQNLTLLCRRHHTHVHQHGLRASITNSSTSWHV